MLTDDEQNAFKAAADRCVAAAEAAGGPDVEPFEDESTDGFIELVVELLDKYEQLSGIRYNGRTFVPEYDEDEDGVYITGIRWIEDEKLEVIE